MSGRFTSSLRVHAFLWRAAWRAHAGETIALMVTAVLAAAALPVAALTATHIARLAAGTPGTAPLIPALTVLGLTVFFAVLAHWAQAVWTLRLGERVAQALDDQVVSTHLHEADLSAVTQPQYLRRLALFEENRDQLPQAVALVGRVFGFGIQLVIVVVLLAVVQPLLLAVLIPGAIGTAPLVRRAGRELYSAYAETALEARRAQHLFEVGTTVAAGKEIRTFELRDRLRLMYADSWRRQDAVFHRARLRSSLLNSLSGAIQAAVVFASLWLILEFGGPGRVDQFVLTLLVVVPALAVSTRAVSLLQGGGSLLRLIEEVIAFRAPPVRTATAVEIPNAAPPQADGQGGLSLSGVGFSYPGAERPALSEVDLVVPPGSLVAVVGGNGAGKSTLVSLLAGLRTPTHGVIRFDGAVSDPTERRDRRTDAAVWQDFGRFHHILRETVRIGDDRIPGRDLAVARAISGADADELVAGLPGGLDAPLGETMPGGVDLSIGQWQRLAIARSLMRPHARLLVLDEPTSALDPLAERAFLELGLRAARAAAASTGAITVFVSHRLAVAPHADLVVVVDRGRVVEADSPAALMAAGGRYAQLFDAQQRRYLGTPEEGQLVHPVTSPAAE